MSTVNPPPRRDVDLATVRKAWKARIDQAYLAHPPDWWLLQLGLDDMTFAFQQLTPFFDDLSAPDAATVFVELVSIRDGLTPIMCRYLAITTNLDTTSRWDNVPSADKPELGNICLICADEYLDEHTVVRSPCGHFLHRGCLENWLVKGHTTCPFCRRDFTILCMMYMWAGTDNTQGAIEMWKNKDQIMSAGR